MENSLIRKIIKEALEEEFQEVINEGVKDWALAGLLALSSLAGIAQTKQELDPKKIGAKEIQTRIKNNDPELAKLFSPKELQFISANADKLASVDEKDFSDYDMQVMNSKNLKSAIANARVYGYAISDIKIQSDTILPVGTTIFTKDTMEIEYNGDALFKTAEFSLTTESISNIRKTIQDISSEYTITKLTIVSSTDREPFPKMGNYELARLRAESVRNIIEGYVDSSVVDIKPLPVEGPDVFNPTMTTQQRIDARKITASSRFVRIIIEAEKEIVVETTSTTIPKIVNSYKIELVKLISYGGGQKIRGKNLKRKVYTKSKCNKVEYDGHMIDCTLTF